ncbi:MAG: aldose epimerase [Lysobacteraceae bacterium]|nr:MAG: aldose epimerase [Xanthomonadaceae bacterium]
MVPERQPLLDPAMAPIAPGPLLRLARGHLQVDVAPEAGGRIAQITHRGLDQLVDHRQAGGAMIGWGCYPMVPWAGRVRRGRFAFHGLEHQLPLNLGGHAIHGVGFAMAWRVESQALHRIELSLALPQDERWPFGGRALQRIELGEDSLQLTLSVQAGSLPMPAVIGWHPWFRKPGRLDFSPSSMYPRDVDGVAILPPRTPSAGPWDDCFVNRQPVALESEGQTLTLRSDCTHWVVYDETPYATCVEPQSGPPDAFNIDPFVLAPGAALVRDFHIAWADR